VLGAVNRTEVRSHGGRMDEKVEPESVKERVKTAN